MYCCSLTEAISAYGEYDFIVSVFGSNHDPKDIQQRPNQLVLIFDDIVDSSEKLILPSKQHVEDVLKFGQHLPKKDILIHCRAGVSRSPALAIALMSLELGTADVAACMQKITFSSPWILPNKRIIAIADDLLYRQGALLLSYDQWLRQLGYRNGRSTEQSVVKRHFTSNSISAEVTVPSNTNAEKIFAYLLDADNEVDWIGPLVSSKRLTSDPIGVGSVFEQTAQGSVGQVRVSWEWVTVDWPNLLHAESIGGDYKFAGGYRLRSIEGGTEITKYATFERTGMLRIVPKSLGNQFMKSAFNDWMIDLVRQFGAD